MIADSRYGSIDTRYSSIDTGYGSIDSKYQILDNSADLALLPLPELDDLVLQEQVLAAVVCEHHDQGPRLGHLHITRKTVLKVMYSFQM